MTVRVKEGARLNGIQPEMVLATLILSRLTTEVVITSGSEDTPNRIEDSLHYLGLALDYRWPDSADRATWRNALVEALGPEYDVVFYEPTATNPGHIHIEYDPDPLP